MSLDSLRLQYNRYSVPLTVNNKTMMNQRLVSEDVLRSHQIATYHRDQEQDPKACLPGDPSKR